MDEKDFREKNRQMRLKRKKESTERIDKILSRLTCFNSGEILQELEKEVKKGKKHERIRS